MGKLVLLLFSFFVSPSKNSRVPCDLVSWRILLVVREKWCVFSELCVFFIVSLYDV